MRFRMIVPDVEEGELRNKVWIEMNNDEGKEVRLPAKIIAEYRILNGTHTEFEIDDTFLIDFKKKVGRSFSIMRG